MDVSIIIVNYNTYVLTSNCIQSIIDKTIDITYEIIVVDNSSTDNSNEWFEKDNLPFTLIKNNKNIGFGGACNIGLDCANGKYSFFLNSDTILVNNAIKIFYDFCENSGNIYEFSYGVIGSILLDQNGSVNQSFDTFLSPKRALWDLLYPYLCYLKLIKTKCYPIVLFEKDFYPVDYVIGADMFINTELARKYNGLDSKFFMYYEETDFQYRLHLDGYFSYIINGPKIIHLEGQSGQKNSRLKQFLLEESVFKYLRKHYTPSLVYFVKFIYIMSYIVKLLNIRNLKRNFGYLVESFSY